MSPRQTRVLLIEDHTELRERTAAALRDAGYVVEEASEGRLGLSLALDEPPDVLVLDLGLPGMDGISLCTRLRAACAQPVAVLMLTARDALSDKLDGFAAGADDYLVKPFATLELLARVQALSKRRTLLQATELQIGPLTLDARKRLAVREGVSLILPPAAFALLHALMQAHPRAVSRSDLIAALWPDGPPVEGDPDVLRTHVFALRQALDRSFAEPMLVTVHGMGLRLQIP